MSKGFVQSGNYSPVPYFLYCRSIELVLKAFLRVKGVPIKDLKKIYGHNLKKILKTAQKLNLAEYVNITSEQQKEISKANKYYQSKGFEYFQVSKAVRAYPELPDISVLEKVASELINNLEIVCLNAA